MRLVFSSQRLETVEGVAKLLNEQGIETLIRNGRGYKGNRRQMFSYRNPSENPPEVWVLHNDDKVRARQYLYENKLIESTRDRTSYLAQTSAANDLRERKQSRALMVRMGLLGLLVIGAMLMLMNRTRSEADRADPALQPPFQTQTALPVPPSLARSALQQGIDLGVMPALCLSINGNVPGNRIMEKLEGNGKRILPASHCVRDPDPQYGSHTGNNDPAEFIDISNFRAQSATAGLVDINTYHHSQWAHYRTYRVVLENGKWRIVKLTRHVAA